MKWSWFQHDNDARNDIQFQTAADGLMSLYEWQGMEKHDVAACIAYAEYFQILEVMDTAPGWMIDISNKAIVRHLERSVMIQDGRLRERLDVYTESGLFDTKFLAESGKLSSTSFIERNQRRARSIEAGSKGGRPKGT